ncbi:MAG: EAL domain-containing protein [Schwartzia sp.]|nr:EAL domain-containing protein [Schwartzia sp. (in: firmicutes)]
MRRLIRFLFLAMSVLLALADPCHATRPTIRVGYFNSPIYLTKTASGDYTGAIYVNLETAMAYAGFRTEYIPVSTEDAMNALQTGKIDVLAGVVSRSPRDSEAFDMLDRVISATPVYLARHYTSKEPAHKLRIAYLVPVYGALVDYYRERPKDDDLAPFEMVPYENMEQFYLDVRGGVVDGYLSSDFQPDETFPVERVLMPTNVYLAVKHGNRALREKIETGIEKALAIDPNFRARGMSDDAGKPLILNHEEQEYLRAHPTLQIGFSGHQPPIVYYEGDMTKGIIPDILTIMSQDLGLRFEPVQEENNKRLLERLAAGEIEAVALFDRNFNRAHEVNANITSPYLVSEYIPVRRRYESLPEKPRVACPRGHVFIGGFVQSHYTPDQIVWCDTFTDCYDAVSKGRADFLLAKSSTVHEALESGRYGNLYTTGQSVASQHLVMAISERVNPVLLGILNKEIAHLGRTRIEAIRSQYIANTHSRKSWRAFIYENPLTAISVSFLIALAIAGVAFYIVRSRREAAKQLFDAAYVNPFTGVHTMSWFEKFVPGLIRKKHKKDRAEGNLYLMSLQAHRFDLLKATYDQQVLIDGISQLIHEVRGKNNWLLYDSISSELSQMFILFRKPEGMTPLEAADKVMNDAAEIKGSSVSIHMNYHIGICDVPKKGDIHLPQLMTNAAIARNEADVNGEHIGLYDSKLQDRRVLEKKIEDLMYKALEEEEFEVWLQPKYDIRTHRVIGAEALVRWQSPELGFLMPGHFIDLFEKNGFIVPFDYYMLEHVCRLQKLYEREGQHIVPIAVNQSGLHMRESGYVKRMGEIRNLYPLPHRAVELELTETAFIDYATKTEGMDAPTIVAALREMGYAIAMDDFCTGYSSISMLQRLPMDIMKIDRAMLLASEDSPRGQKILRNVVNFGHSLDMLVLCEGIETEAQEALLLENGCNYGQGFLFSRPMPSKKYTEFLHAHEIA